MSIETCLRPLFLEPWDPSFQSRNVTSVAIKPQDQLRTDVRLQGRGKAYLVLRDSALRATVFSRAIALAPNSWNLTHGTAADLDQFAGEAGRGCCRVQQPGAFGGVQVSAVSRRAYSSAEGLSGSVVWGA